MLTAINGVGKFSVLVPAAYPHLFLYLSQGHSLIPRRRPELGSRALPCDGSPGGERGRRRRGGGRVAPPAAGRAHTCPKARPRRRQGVVPRAEEGPRAGGRAGGFAVGAARLRRLEALRRECVTPAEGTVGCGRPADQEPGVRGEGQRSHPPWQLRAARPGVASEQSPLHSFPRLRLLSRTPGVRLR